MNKIILTGRLTANPELKEIQKNEKKTKVAVFRLAVDRIQANTNQKTDFFVCEAFNSVAENVYKYIKKGSKILVEGEMRMDTQTSTNESGGTDYRTFPKVRVSRIEFLESKKAEENNE